MFHVVIPARYAASRLPGKPLLRIGEKPLIQWVWESARASGAASVLVATDDERIRDAAAGFGAECVMTSARHASGTDRIAEVVRLRGFGPDEAIVNLQGDEPLLPPSVIAQVAAALRPGIGMTTAVAPVESLAQFLDANCVKALRPCRGLAIEWRRIARPRSRGPGGTSASMRIAWPACSNSQHGRPPGSRSPKSSNNCARWNTGCAFNW